MIWRLRSEGAVMRYGLNWYRDATSPLILMICWRTVTHVYSTGVRVRSRRAASHGGRRVIVRPLRRSCLYCDWRRDIVCAKHWRLA